MNLVVLTGRLVQDPNGGARQDGTAICRFSIAVKRAYATTKNQVDFIDCFSRGTIAEYISKYGKKGMMCAVRGDIQTFEKPNKDTPATKPAKGFNISVDKFEILSSKQEMNNYNNKEEMENPQYFGNNNGRQQADNQRFDNSKLQEIDDDDFSDMIPF